MCIPLTLKNLLSLLRTRSLSLSSSRLDAAMSRGNLRDIARPKQTLSNTASYLIVPSFASSLRRWQGRATKER